jgi:uncharacterized membrane protein YphA (DoxX/SURF4 family)
MGTENVLSANASIDATAATQRTTAGGGTSWTRHIPTVGRIFLGLVFFVFGLNGFLNFIPPPKGPVNEGAMALGFAMMKSGYLFQLIKGTEVLAGALLLANRFVPLALAIIAPVIVNIVAFHAFLEPSGMVLPVLLVVVEVYLAWSYRHVFRPMLSARTTPSASLTAAERA